MRQDFFNMEGFGGLINAVMGIHEIIDNLFLIKVKRVTDLQAAMYERLQISTSVEAEI